MSIGWRPKGREEVFRISLPNGDNPRFFCYVPNYVGHFRRHLGKAKKIFCFSLGLHVNLYIMAKLIYTMGEVAAELGENASAIRYWSNCFEKFIRPQRNAKGNRLYHPDDVETLKQIQYLLKNQGLTLEGAKQRLTEDRRSVDKRVKAIGALKEIRAQLVQVRKAL